MSTKENAVVWILFVWCIHWAISIFIMFTIPVQSHASYALIFVVLGLALGGFSAWMKGISPYGQNMRCAAVFIPAAVIGLLAGVLKGEAAGWLFFLLAAGLIGGMETLIWPDTPEKAEATI
jgi:drug/metabolite transporter (DMT)-like permease